MYLDLPTTDSCNFIFQRCRKSLNQQKRSINFTGVVLIMRCQIVFCF
uniref:Uncharacterized protein n=1 Tax=Arundo donax TaxID=35708 RepID=A0A0A8ZUJ3_ARUDO